MPLPVTDFIVQKIKEHDPTISVTSGTGFYELMVAPLSVILQPLRDEINTLVASQTILQVLETVTPNNFDESTVDYLLSNLRVERKVGAKASTIIRIKFFSAQEFIATAGALTFQDANGFEFKNTLAVNVSQAQMSTHFDGEVYYIDILCTADTSGAGFNLPANTITLMVNEPVGVSSVTNPYAVTNGVSSETNTQFIERAKNAISIRTLVTSPGISSMLTENFESIREASAVGFKDDEMMRDIISNVHVGGYVDAWLKPDSTADGTFSSTAGLEVDTTRDVSGSELITFGAQSPLLGTDPATADLPAIPLSHQNLVSGSVVVKNATEVATYSSPGDYTVDLAGSITRTNGGTIAYFETVCSSGSITPATKTIQDNTVNFVGLGVTVGDRVVISQATYGGSVSASDGLYTVATVAANIITVNELMPGVTVALGGGVGLGYAIYGRLRVDYLYNPVSIDFSAIPRAGRDLQTITDVPLLHIEEIEELSPITYEPTGVYYQPGGGWSNSGFGVGPWGVGDSMQWMLRVVKPENRFSMVEDLFIDFDHVLQGKFVRVTFMYSPDIAAVHTFATDPLNRDVAADVLVKHTIPALFHANIDYEVAVGDATTTTETMLSAIEEFVHSLGIGVTLELSDLVDTMYDNGAVKVTLPIEGEIEIQNTDASMQVVPSEDELTIPDNLSDDPNQRPLSARISHILPGDITLTQGTA